MERCDTCRYWSRFHDSGSCLLIGTNSGWTELQAGERAVISMEVDAYEAHLQTAPDFGCVLHEPHEVNNDAAE